MKNLFHSERYADYLKTMSRFHTYSPRNALLIYMQRPDATFVAGFQAWQDKFKRHVKGNEKSKAIKILAPMSSTKRKAKEKLDPETKLPILDEHRMPVVEYVQLRSARFRTVDIYDVSQTDGQPLPMLVQPLSGNVEQYAALMDTLRTVSPLPIVIEPLPEDTDGLCIFGDKIAIRVGMSEIQTVSAAIHEVTHAKLHDLESLRLMGKDAVPKNRRTQEVEAESVSYAVCQHFGIETGANSFGYIAEWSKTRELKELRTSLDTIHKTAAALIGAIEGKFQEIVKARNIDKSQPGAANAGASESEKQYDLNYGHLGNGLTVWNRLEEKDGDYVKVAHIGPDRSIAFYDKDMPGSLKAEIEQIARTSDARVSVTQPEKHVFDTPPQFCISDLSLPDPTIDISKMNAYGYTWDYMLPLTAKTALELYDADHTIYLLYPDNTEAMAFDRDEIAAHDGIFGIEKDEWEASLEFAQMQAVTRNSEGSREAELIYGKENRFGIYQIPDGIEKTRNFRFTPMRELEALGLHVDRSNYQLVYTAPFTWSDTATGLNQIFGALNSDTHPAEYAGRSLSVGDVIVLKRAGEISSHFVDSVGFVELNAFLGEEQRGAPSPEIPIQNMESDSYSQLGNTRENADRDDASKAKLSLTERLAAGKRRAAQQGLTDTQKSKDLEV